MWLRAIAISVLLASPALAQPSVEVLPTENVTESEQVKPTTAEDIKVNLFSNRLQAGKGTEYANFSLQVAALRNVEVSVIVEPAKGELILSNTDIKQVLKGTTASFAGVATKGSGIIKVTNAKGDVIKVVPYQVGKRASLRQSIGFNAGYNIQIDDGTSTFSQSARYSISDVKGNWGAFVNVNRSDQSQTGESYGTNVGVNFNFD